MASLNINNHVKSSLEFVHRATVVYLRYFGSFLNQRQFKVSTLVCVTEHKLLSFKEEFQKIIYMVIDVKGGRIEK